MNNPYAKNSQMFTKLLAVVDSFPKNYSNVIEHNPAYADLKRYIALTFHPYYRYVQKNNLEFADLIQIMLEGIQLPKGCRR